MISGKLNSLGSPMDHLIKPTPLKDNLFSFVSASRRIDVSTCRSRFSLVSDALNRPASSHCLSNRFLRSSMDRPSVSTFSALIARNMRLRSRSFS
ncbi:MAG: hypothetical protein M2R46_04657 [Verrucomicrobia subdivision 3 bacterium]|nr:hypothetical protein [Limisphaerales bacterium]